MTLLFWLVFGPGELLMRLFFGNQTWGGAHVIFFFFTFAFWAAVAVGVTAWLTL